MLCRCLAISLAVVGADLGRPAFAQTDTTTPNIPGVVAAGTRVQLLVRGLQGTEGPVAAPDGSLIFTEQNANRISKIDANGRVTPFLSNTNGTIGLAYDSHGRLIAAQTINPQIAVLLPTRDVLADSFEGSPLLRPNDLTVDSRGGIYFSDAAVLYIRPDGDVIKVADVDRPHGLALSPDEKILYVANTLDETILAFDVHADGTIAGRREFAKVATGGITVDSAGRVYVATRIGVQIFSPQGARLGTIPIGMADGPQNLAFAGFDRKTLFVVGRGAVWKVGMQAQGVRRAR